MFSIIVCSHRPARAEFIRRHYAGLFRDQDHEIIVIPDALSLCEGYARGIRQSRGDRLVFSHDDVEFITPDAASRIERHLLKYDLIGIAGTTRVINGVWFDAGDPDCFVLVVYPETDGMYSVRYAGAGALCVPGIHALDGCLFACRRHVAEAIGFDEDSFDGFHLYDLDFTYRAHLSGFRLAVCRDLALIHASMGNPDEVWMRYRKRFDEKFAGRLDPGSPGALNVISLRLPKDQLAAACDPENLARSLPWPTTVD